jgi:hypothetical protein
VNETKPFGVLVVTHGGVSGLFDMVETREKGEELVEQMLRLEKEQPDAKTTFSPFGMGSGAPLPLRAVKAWSVLGPGEKLSDDVIEKAVECAKKFRQAIGI